MRRVSKRLLSTIAPLQICAFVAGALLKPTRGLFIPSRHDIIGRRLRGDAAARAMALARREDEGCNGASSPLQEQGTASEDGDAVQAPSKSIASDLGGDVERRTVKLVVD